MSVERTERNGLPVWWAEAPGPFSMSLHVRVGRADEPLHLGGITSMIERLVVANAGYREHPHDAYVDSTQCVFWAEGERDEVLEYLALAGQAIATPDLAGIEDARRDVRAETLRGELDNVTRMLVLRFGPAGYGHSRYTDFGVRWVGAPELLAWWERHFTRANAVLMLSGEPPEDLGFTLPDGERVPPPEPAPLNHTLPGFSAGGRGSVVLAGLVPRDIDASVAGIIAYDRLNKRVRKKHGLTLAVSLSDERLGNGPTQLGLAVDVRDGDPTRLLTELWGCAQRLAEDGPAEGEIEAEYARRAARSGPDARAVLRQVGAAVEHELMGRPPDTPEGEGIVDAAGVVRVMRAMVDSAILNGPYGSRPIAGLQALRIPPAGAFDGERFPGHLGDELWIGEHGLGRRDGEDRMTLPWDRVGAAEALLDGQVRVIATDGRWMMVSPSEWEDGERATALVRERLPAELVLPPADKALCAQIDAMVQQRIGDRALIASQLAVLPLEITPEEGVVDLAPATRLDTRTAGLLVVTARRVLWLPTVGEDRITLERGEVEARPNGGTLALAWSGAEVHFAISPEDAVGELAGRI